MNLKYKNVKDINVEIDEIRADIQDLASHANSDILCLRENIINELNGLMDYLVQDALILHDKLKDLKSKIED